MRSFLRRVPVFLLLLVGAVLLGETANTRGQGEEPEEGRLKTLDGLKLAYTWYDGGKSQTSDCVLLVHGYGSDSSKGPWSTLAKSLQKKGYSVLSFDMRGHGKSADFKVMGNPDVFCKNTFNRYAGYPLNPKTIKELKKERFQLSYYPYLVNDITAARRFLDEKNDASKCNSGRVFVIAEQSACPLVMLWLATEHARQAFGGKTMMDVPERVSAGNDVCGVVFLSWAGSAGPGTNTAISVANKVMRDKEYGSETILIEERVKQKVAMAFVYGKDDKASAGEARYWFNKFGIPPNKTADKELVKYILEVPGAEKLAGIKLLDILEKPKDKDEKVSFLETNIIDFIASTKLKGINGGNWKERNLSNVVDPIPVPLDLWGLKLPK
ncbi:MAG: alpha/beta hydrolase [Planctomycetes bacterium]|nr:alpha/beta hydrolase [Planctomycetota bacterium]